MISWVFTQWEPVAGGRLLLATTGTVTTATAPLLGLDRDSWALFATVTLSMTVVLAASFVVPWTRMPSAATAAFPVSVWVAIAALGIGGDGLGANFTGLFFLCFAYLGITQPPGTIVKLTPLAAACYFAAYGRWTEPLTARALIAVIAWLLLAVLITELVERHAALTIKLQRAARTDALTGLANRRDLDYRVALAAPGDSLVILDLDHFKEVNDMYGHAAGDRVLAEFGLIILACLREDDYAARYGGEEFALLLPATDADHVEGALQRLRSQWALHRPGVTFSAGIATCRNNRIPQRTLVAADVALYVAKAAGRDRNFVENSDLGASARARLETIADRPASPIRPSRGWRP